MGCWNETCAITNLPILYGEAVYGLMLSQWPADAYSSRGCHAGDFWQLLPCMVQGNYDDYGRVEDIDDLDLELIRKHQRLCDIDGDKLEDITQELLFKLEKDGKLFHANIYGSAPRLVQFIMIKKTVIDDIKSNFKLKYHYPVREYTYQQIVDTMIEYCNNYAQSLKVDDYSDTLLNYDPSIGRKVDPFAKSILQNCRSSVIDWHRVANQDQKSIERNCEYITLKVLLDNLLDGSRQLWSPTAGKGSQDTETDIHRYIANLVLSQADIVDKQSCYDDEMDEDDE